MARNKKDPFSSLFFSKKTSLTAIITLIAFLIIKVLDEQSQVTVPSTFPSSPPAQETRLPDSTEAIQLYSNQTQDDLIQLYVSAIRSAQKSINLVIYTLTDPQVMDALRDKAQAGVPVYIVCDAQASKGISRLAHPNITIVRRAGKALTHQKILVIDDTNVILGSTNLSSDSLRVYGNLVVAFQNPALAQLLSAKIRSMDESGGTQPLMHKEVTIGSQQLELWILPDDRQAVNRMKSLFRSAKKTIKVAMFTFTRRDFVQELIDASKRGVKVEVVIDRYSGKGVSSKIANLLAASDIPVGLSTGKGLLHHKFAYIDGTILVNGSANWTNNAFTQNDDCFIILQPLTPEQQDKLDRLWSAIQNESERVPKR